MKRSQTRQQGLESPNAWGEYLSSLIDVEESAWRDVQEIEAFAREYLPHHLVDQETGEPVDFADFHREIFEIVQDLKTKKREAWAAPRGHGKSTVLCLIVVLWWVCYRRKRFIVLVSDTSSQAEALLQAVIAELEENEKLRSVFHLGPAYDRQGNVVSWRDDEIAVDNGVTVAAKGAGKSIRGLKKKAFRPDAVIIDDLENDESVGTKYQRDKLTSWLEKTLLNLVSKNGDVYFIGTILHYDSVLSRVMKKTSVWNVRLWRAIEKDEALWPAYWPLEALAEKRLEIGSIAFACEFLNDPLESGEHPLRKEWFAYYDPQHLPTDRIVIIQTVDPAVSEKTTADYTAVCTLGYADGKFWLIEMLRDRLTITRLVKTLEQQFAKHRPVAQGIESQGFQLSAVQLMSASNAIPVYEIHRTKDKVARAIGVSVHFEQGRVLFPRGAPWLDDLEEELVRFPAGEHDDMVDALVDAINGFMPGQPMETVVVYEEPQQISKY